MAPRVEFGLDAATGLAVGARQRQEDAVLIDAPQGGAAGILVLSDGLGGHAAGAVASRIAVTTALAEMAARRDPHGTLGGDIPGFLRAAAEAANKAILAHADGHPESAGMGATLVIAVVQSGGLHWLSIGDSPLFLVRAGRLRQLNAIHSLAPQLDLLARMGELAPEIAANHPDRSCLTSALGCHPLRQVDCPPTALELRSGDVILAASDGILTLPEQTIDEIVRCKRRTAANDIAARLLNRIAAIGAEGQDNVSVAVFSVKSPPRLRAGVTHLPEGGAFHRFAMRGGGASTKVVSAIRSLLRTGRHGDVAVRSGSLE